MQLKSVADQWRRRVRHLKLEVYALYLAYRDPRTPWSARLVAGIVVAYALSPIDLIPDPIPILGYLDDLILLPIGILLALKLIPPVVLADCRRRAQALAGQQLPISRIAAFVIIGLWLFLAGLFILGVARMVIP